MQNIKEVFELVGKRKFIETYTTLNPDSGVQNRMSGKGTNAKDKRTEPKPEEMVQIKAGLKKLAADLKKAADIL